MARCFSFELVQVVALLPSVSTWRVQAIAKHYLMYIVGSISLAGMRLSRYYAALVIACANTDFRSKTGRRGRRNAS